MSDKELWYRYQDRRTSSMNEWEEVTIHFELNLETFEVVRHTAKGVWLTSYPGVQPHFVLKSARKRFACPTKEEAIESFLARKRKQRSIHQAWINYCDKMIAKGEVIQNKLMSEISGAEFEAVSGSVNPGDGLIGMLEAEAVEYHEEEGD